MIKALILALTLQGHVFFDSGGRGVIGVRVNHSSHIIGKVWTDSPAERAGILVNDKVYMVDNKLNNTQHIDGKPATMVDIWVDRGQERLFFSIQRIDSRLIGGGYSP